MTDEHCFPGQVSLEPGAGSDHVCGDVGALDQVLVQQVLLGHAADPGLGRRHRRCSPVREMSKFQITVIKV